MIQPSDGVRPLDARTLAAAIAAVQAYFDEEARASRPPGAPGLGPWKTAPWRMLRGWGTRRTLSWPYDG